MQVIIDGNNMTLIGYAVVISRVARGEVTDIEGALTGLLGSMIQKLMRTLGTGDYYVVWDTYGGTAQRKEIDESYKGTRDHTRFDYQTVESCKTLYEAYNIKSISIDACEGDDAIFSLAKYLKEKHLQDRITLVTRDKDMIQVVQRGYANDIWDISKKAYMTIPDYDIVQYKALVGDPADNIKGVKGIGPKTALKILAGEVTLTDQQQAQRETALKLVDATLNPFYERNNEEIKRIMENIGK